jgi:tripartite-type tricarboxylate transporter receptor subunit TctC
MAQGDAWPNRPVRILVGFGAGGVTDVAIRVMAEALRPSLSQPIVIENRPGASGMLAAGLAARAAPDGHTLISIPGTITIVPAAMRNLPIDVLKDLTPITLFATSPNVMVVHPTFPARNLGEFVAYARSRPAEDIAYASSGIGTTVHFMAGMLERSANIRMRHIPYRSSTESIQAVIAGEPKVVFSSINSALPHIRSGAVRALGVSSERRSDFVPDIPTFNEQGVRGVRSETWFGLAGPANMPRPLVEHLAGLFNGALRDPALRQRLAALGAEPVGLGPDEFGALMAREVDEFKSLGAAMGLQPE